MKFKLLIAIVDDTVTERVVEAARSAGATGATIIKSASGEGLEAPRTFFGLTLETQRDVVLLVVEAHLARHILETIAEAGEFGQREGMGIAFQVDIEDVVGIDHQISVLKKQVEEEI